MFKRRKPDELSAAESAAASSQALFGAGKGEKEGSKSDSPVAARPNVSVSPAPGAKPTDRGLGVPPFRPVPPKEADTMSRSPFATTPPATPPAPPPASGPRPAPVVPGRAAGRDPAERRMLVVGRGISLQGTVQDAERLVVEGTVEATMIHAVELSISPGGVFKGEVEVEEAEVAGTIDGTLTARASLTIRSTGRVLGTARCRRLQVEDGGQITGRMEMLTEGGREAPRVDATPKHTPETAG